MLELRDIKKNTDKLVPSRYIYIHFSEWLQMMFPTGMQFPFALDDIGASLSKDDLGVY